MTSTLLRGGRVLAGAGEPVVGDVLVVDGRVSHVGEVPRRDVDVVVDADGLLVAPGLVDLQVNGAHGVDITAEPERLWEVAAQLPAYGVTAFCPTVISSSPDVPGRAMSTVRAGRGAAPLGARVLGVHLEGPMLEPSRRGAHQGEHLVSPTSAIVSEWTLAQGVALVTLAPELAGARDVVEHLVSNGVVVSMGHSAAETADVRAAADAGASLVTHVFNAMPGLSHREPGLVGVALTDERLHASLIVDGLHVDPLVVDLAWRSLGRRLVLVSDAAAALGLPPGTTRLGDQQVVVSAHGVRLSDGTLAGSAVGLDACVRNLVAFTGCSVAEAVGAATAAPAAVVGRTDVGTLARGAAGDAVLLDDDLCVVATVVAGDVVHDRRGRPS